MRALLWAPVAAIILVWSLVAWLIFSLTDWLFGVVASLFGAILGGWASWLINGVGDLAQIGVVIVWLIVTWIVMRPVRG